MKKGGGPAMKANEIRRICVVGAGRQGSRIALRAAVHEFEVSLVDKRQDLLLAAMQNGQAWLESERGKIESGHAAAATVLSRLHPTTSLSEGAEEADFVFEVVFEDVETKRAVFAELDAICQPEAIIGTGSSSIRVSLIEDATRRPDKVINAHFFIDPAEDPSLEIMRGTQTSDETLEATIGLARRLGLVPLVVKREITGFLFNRIWRAIKKEALLLADGDYADPEDIDRAFMLALKTQSGPFQMMDQIGLDVVLAIERIYYQESGDNRDKPPRILVDKVERGELGRRVGKGFYEYPGPSYERPGWLRKEE
jgi:3-hydroxybutyryl-CoA dehydrogenase